MDHAVFFNKQVALLNHPDNKHRRRFLYKELDAWYTEFKPTKKHKGRSLGRTSLSMVVDVDANEIFIGRNIDNFDDPLDDDALPPRASAAFGALAAVATNATAGGGG